MKAKKAVKRIVVIILILLSLFLIWTAGIRLKKYMDLNTDIDRENILEHITFDEEISDSQRNHIKGFLQRVDKQSLNFVVNSGGKIVVIFNEDLDIREYLDQHYGYNLMETTYNKIQGVTVPYGDIFGNVYKADVIIACDYVVIGEIIHEFGHVYDITHGDISSTPEFQEIYNNRENINKTVLKQVITSKDYISSTSREYFAELYKQYSRGKFCIAGHSEEKDYLIEYFDSLSIQR